MLKKKEISAIIIATLVLSFVVSIGQPFNLFLYSLSSIILILGINIAAKKITSYWVDSEIEVGLWEIKRAGLLHILDINPFSTSHPSTKFKRNFPAGAFIPILSKIILFPFNGFAWMASLVFEVEPKKYRAAKRYETYAFSEMTEYHIGLIAAAGIAANLLFAIIGYLIGLPPEMNFVQLSMWFALFNMIPLSDLDGNKIFFGSLIMWSFLAAIVLIGVLCALMIV